MSGWDAFWDGVGAFLSSGWGTPVQVVIVIVVAVLVRLVLQAIIRRFVERVISGAKKKAGVAETTALAISPLAESSIRCSRAICGRAGPAPGSRRRRTAADWPKGCSAPYFLKSYETTS